MTSYIRFSFFYGVGVDVRRILNICVCTNIEQFHRFLYVFICLCLYLITLIVASIQNGIIATILRVTYDIETRSHKLIH